MHIQFAELPVIDQDRAKAFYTEHLACQLIADQPMGDSGWRWIELAFPFAVTNLHFIRRADDAPDAEPVMVLVEHRQFGKLNVHDGSLLLLDGCRAAVHGEKTIRTIEKIRPWRRIFSAPRNVFSMQT